MCCRSFGADELGDCQSYHNFFPVEREIWFCCSHENVLITFGAPLPAEQSQQRITQYVQYNTEYTCINIANGQRYERGQQLICIAQHSSIADHPTYKPNTFHIVPILIIAKRRNNLVFVHRTLFKMSGFHQFKIT